MPRDLTTLLHDTAAVPAERADVDRLVRRGRRRRRARHVVAPTAAAGALVGIVMVGASVLGSPQAPTVADQPDGSSPPAVEIPDGWTTVVAGDLAMSVPPDWTFAITTGPDTSSDQRVCRIAMPPSTDADELGPSAGGVMVDLGPPVQSPCSPEVLNTTAVRPTVWLVSTSRSENELDAARESGTPVRLGTVDAWRVDRSPFVQFVVKDLSRVVWAAPAGHPNLDAVLNTVRPATDEERARFAERVAALEMERRHAEEHARSRPASQSAEDATRDGVLPAVAVLPFHVRVEIQEWDAPTEVVTDEGVWVVSRMNTELSRDYSEGCGIGDVHDPDAQYIRDVICDTEYGEVLLLNHDQDRILRAFPLPSAPPQTLLVTDDAVYCARQGDGGLPNSMLCRIDRATGEWMVRLFRYEDDVRDPWPPADVLPDHWILDRLPDEHAGSMYGQLRIDNGVLVIEHGDVVTRFDPNTLELRTD